MSTSTPTVTITRVGTPDKLRFRLTWTETRPLRLLHVMLCEPGKELDPIWEVAAEGTHVYDDAEVFAGPALDTSDPTTRQTADNFWNLATFAVEMAGRPLAEFAVGETPVGFYLVHPERPTPPLEPGKQYKVIVMGAGRAELVFTA